MQFTDQVEEESSGRENNVCIEQWDLEPEIQNKICAEGSFSSSTEGHPGIAIESWTAPGAFLLPALGIAWASWEDGQWEAAVAVVVPDIYGLGDDERWANASGTILGFGEGSEAHFSGTEMQTALGVSSCKSTSPVLGFVPFSESCKKSEKLQPYAFPMESRVTAESNDLKPVIGSLPTLKYHKKYAAEIEYTDTTTGKCWTGKAPHC